MHRHTALLAVDTLRTAGDDVDLAVQKLRAIGGAGTDVLTLVHPGTPIPKERPRASRDGHFYTPGKTREAERILTLALRSVRGRRVRFADTVAIVVIFFVATLQRKDADNCLKLCMDAGTRAGIWHDDSQVKAQAVFFELDVINPRTVIAICPYLTSLTRKPLLLDMEPV